MQYFQGEYVVELFSQTKGYIKSFVANTLIIFSNEHFRMMNLLWS